jgi:hypothetical protein
VFFVLCFSVKLASPVYFSFNQSWASQAFLKKKKNPKLLVQRHLPLPILPLEAAHRRKGYGKVGVSDGQA